MVHLKHINTKRVLIKSNKDADTILNSSLGNKFQVIKQDKRVDTPPEVMEKVSISPKAQEKKLKGNSNKNADR